MTRLFSSAYERLIPVITAISGLFMSSIPASADGFQGWRVEAHEMTISGTSSTHDWVSDVTWIQANGSLELINGEFEGINDLVVEIPVKGIISPHKLMDRLTHRALKEDTYPFIRYELVDLNRIEDGRWLSTGALTIAGTTLPWDMEVQVLTDENGGLVVTGSSSFKMTQFGVKPPSLMLGVIKVRDPIRVDFEVTLSKKYNPLFSQVQ